jgi:hypothetical protein
VCRAVGIGRQTLFSYLAEVKQGRPKDA